MPGIVKAPGLSDVGEAGLAAVLRAIKSGKGVIVIQTYQDKAPRTVAHIVDLVRFITGEEVVSVEGAIEHTFIEERAVLEEPRREDMDAFAGLGRAALARRREVPGDGARPRTLASSPTPAR